MNRFCEQCGNALQPGAGFCHGQSRLEADVEGHTDNIGGDACNLDLSKRRALAVKEAL